MDYVAVHLVGEVALRPQAELRDLLSRQSAIYEDMLAPKTPWTTAKIMPDVLDQMMRQIVPWRMDITEVRGTWKLNQKKPGSGAPIGGNPCRYLRYGAGEPVVGHAYARRLSAGQVAACLLRCTACRQKKERPEMKLLMGPTSPFARKVAAVLHELDMTDAVEQENVTTTPINSDPAVVAANPLGKVPVLIRPDGPALYDSRVICRYLDSQAGGALYPQIRVWETLTLEAMGDAIMDAGVSMIYETRMRPEDKQWDGWLDAQWAKITSAMDALEARWMSHLAAPLDMGQIAVACALSYIDFRQGHRDWRAARPQLAAWLDVFSDRSSMQKTRPE